MILLPRCKYILYMVGYKYLSSIIPSPLLAEDTSGGWKTPNFKP